MNKTLAFTISFILTLLIYTTLSHSSNSHETLLVSRVIDGDTLQVEDGRTIRLVNINTPERGKRGYQEAKDYLAEFENTLVSFQFLGQDKYHRFLARASTDKDLNKEIIKLGLGSTFLVHKSDLDSFSKAQEEAIRGQRGLWKKSKHFGCFKTKINDKEEKVILTNICPEINLDSWILKDESRKEYRFSETNAGSITLHSYTGEDQGSSLYWNLNQDVWNNGRDTLFLFDNAGGLAHYDSYGY